MQGIDNLMVFHRGRWPCWHRPSKGLSVHKQAKDTRVHLDRCRAADRHADEAFHARPYCQRASCRWLSLSRFMAHEASEARRPPR